VTVLVAALPGPVHGAQQPGFAQAADGKTDRGDVVLHHRIPAGGLVAGREQRVVRQRVLLRGRQLLLDEAAEDASLLCGELHLLAPGF
jgi:hypothetical protein